MRVALGIAFFWSLGSLAQMNIDQFGIEGNLEKTEIIPLFAALVIGVGLGSVLAGIWSGGKVELGILPLGAGCIALSAMMLSTVQTNLASADALWTPPYIWSCVWLFSLGVGAGLFDVPLAAYMQHRSPRESRGSILAASNFLTFSGMLLAAIAFRWLRSPTDDPLFSSHEIFLLCGVMTVPVFVYIVWLLPGATIRFVVWLASHTVYRVRVYGRENLPEEGGALLVANHVTWIDGLLLVMTSSRPVRLVAYADYTRGWGVHLLAKWFHVIPIQSGRRAILGALQTAREAVEQGDLVCIFPEGGLTRTGQLQSFKPGMLRIVAGTGVPAIPVFLDELWGSIFSFRDGRFIWKWPRRWPYPVSILFGEPVRQVERVEPIRRAVQQLGVRALEMRKPRQLSLPRTMLRTCRRNRRRPKLADTTGMELTGGGALVASLVLRKLLKREVLSADEKFVGLLLPPSCGGVLVNAALPLLGRVAVNLNYTASSDVLNACIERVGIRHVLTSRKMLERFPLKLDAEMVRLEDLRPKATWLDKLTAVVAGHVGPVGFLERYLGLTGASPDDLLTVIFTSGSTGDPKGVMLTHYNIASNIEAIDQVIQLRASDVLVGILPFFHSLGFTATLWSVLTLDLKGVYHYSPLESKAVGKLCRQHRATLLLSTPTFLRTYLRRCPPEDFASLEVVVAGAEKLAPDLSTAFEEKFGVRPVEGYGATELSPLVSVNVPQSRAWGSEEVSVKDGTVGRPVPGVAVKVVDPDSGEELGVEEPGMLLVKGPNVMQGYYQQPEKTAEVIHDGWYTTGDIAEIDADDFIRITGRLSRFSKIGGEMVPHLKIEEALLTLLEAGEEEQVAVVTAVPDAKKGERLVVLHKPLSMSPAEICKALAESGLPSLWVPSPDSFFEVEEIPVLGTGKLDLRAVKDLAEAKFQ